MLLSESPHIPHVLMRKLRLLRKTQRIAALSCEQTLYFVATKYYSTRTCLFFCRLLSSYDALICIGGMETELAHRVLQGRRRKPLILSVSGAIDAKRRNELAHVSPQLESETIIFVGRGGSGWRVWYKGLDLLLEAFALAQRSRKSLRLMIVGHWDPDTLSELMTRFRLTQSVVEYVGDTPNIGTLFSASSLYLHLGRGDCFPISVLEAMMAGLPALVSKWTGTREAAVRVHPHFVVDIDPQQAADHIIWYFSLPVADRVAFSRTARAVASEYTEERAQEEFKRAVEKTIASPGRRQHSRPS